MCSQTAVCGVPQTVGCLLICHLVGTLRCSHVSCVALLLLQANQEMPDVMLSMEFKRVWRCSRPGARPLSVWRPVGPPGYASLGDVAMPGNEPPARPVSMYRDTADELTSRVSA